MQLRCGSRMRTECCPPDPGRCILPEMLARIASVVLLAAACCALISCEWPWKKKIPRAMPIRFPKANADGARRNPRQVGTILMVNAEGKFVIVDTGMWMPPESGTAL